MNTEQTAKQLELAAQILRTGHPFEVCRHRHQEWFTPNPMLVTEWMPPEYEIRLALSTPWPEAASKPDPYAELKAAHAEGKVIQYRNANSSGAWSEWHDYDGGRDRAAPMPIDSHGGYREWRIKPSAPPFQLPPPPPGMSWQGCFEEWTAGDLPQGLRPLAVGEMICEGDEIKWGKGHEWQKMQGLVGTRCDENKNSACKRTTRPLVFTHAEKTWTYHRPGDPMPCDGERRVYWLMVRDDARLAIRCSEKAGCMRWSSSDTDNSSDIIGWRYADELKTVELGPEDVPPSSVIQLRDRPDSDALAVGFHGVVCVCRTHVTAFNEYGNKITIEWGPLKDWQINRSIPLTGKWNPDAWEPCHKPG